LNWFHVLKSNRLVVFAGSMVASNDFATCTGEGLSTDSANDFASCAGVALSPESARTIVFSGATSKAALARTRFPEGHRVLCAGAENVAGDGSGARIDARRGGGSPGVSLSFSSVSSP
jgi:hypothetical protein